MVGSVSNHWAQCHTLNWGIVFETFHLNLIVPFKVRAYINHDSLKHPTLSEGAFCWLRKTVNFMMFIEFTVTYEISTLRYTVYTISPFLIIRELDHFVQESSRCIPLANTAHIKGDNSQMSSCPYRRLYKL